jgi:hypothetical protein
MTVWIKQGVIGDLQTVAQKGLGRVAHAYEGHGKDLYVTSIRESNHSPGSLHYIGLAFDIRPGLDLDLIKTVLGPQWDVVNESDHIHCEYDPK